MNLKRIIPSLTIALIAVLSLTTVALAVPGLVIFGIPNPSDTSMVLTWTPAPSSNSTVIYYRTDTYPTAVGDGTLSYNGTGFQCNVTGLTAGTIYYFTAWGYDGAAYGNPAYCVMNTLPIAMPSGAEETHTAVIPTPSVPASANATADITGFHLEPFTSMVSYFVTDNATSPGGLGMPVNNAWEMLAIGAIVMGGIGTYTKMKNFFIAYFVVFTLTCVFIGIHLVQWYLAPIELAIGVGVWALERYLQ